MATTSLLPLWQRVEEHVTRFVSSCDALWQQRRRCLDTRHLMLAVFKLVAGRGADSYADVISDLADDAHLRRVSKSSLCVARRKLPAEAFQVLHEQIVKDAAAAWPRQGRHWRGRRVFAVDGTKVTLPRELVAAGYPVPYRGYYPTVLLSCLYCTGSKLPLECLLEATGDERSCAHEHLKAVARGDVVVYDRGYFSYALLREHVTSRKDAIFRLCAKGNFQEIEAFFRSRQPETVVRVSLKSDRCRSRYRSRLSAKDIKPLRLRLVKYRVGGEIYCLGTTLLAKRRFPRQELAKLYCARWGVEELFKSSKQTLQLEAFHSHSENGVRQEIYANVTLLTLARLVTHQAEMRLARGKRAATAWQANSRHALHQIARHLAELIAAHPHKPAKLAALVETLVTHVMRQRARKRPDRHYPRRSRRQHRRWMPKHHVSQPA